MKISGIVEARSNYSRPVYQYPVLLLGSSSWDTDRNQRKVAWARLGPGFLHGSGCNCGQGFRTREWHDMSHPYLLIYIKHSATGCQVGGVRQVPLAAQRILQWARVVCPQITAALFAELCSAAFFGAKSMCAILPTGNMWVWHAGCLWQRSA